MYEGREKKSRNDIGTEEHRLASVCILAITDKYTLAVYILRRGAHSRCTYTHSLNHCVGLLGGIKRHKHDGVHCSQKHTAR